MANLLDERIDCKQSMEWTYGRGVGHTAFKLPNTKVSPNTIVQLIRPDTSDLMAGWWPPAPCSLSSTGGQRARPLANI